MTEKKSNGNAKKAAFAGAAIGSAAVAAAWLFSNRRREKPVGEKLKPAHPEDAPETD